MASAACAPPHASAPAPQPTHFLSADARRSGAVPAGWDSALVTSHAPGSGPHLHGREQEGVLRLGQVCHVQHQHHGLDSDPAPHLDVARLRSLGARVAGLKAGGGHHPEHHDGGANKASPASRVHDDSRGFHQPHPSPRGCSPLLQLFASADTRVGRVQILNGARLCKWAQPAACVWAQRRGMWLTHARPRHAKLPIQGSQHSWSASARCLRVPA